MGRKLVSILIMMVLLGCTQSTSVPVSTAVPAPDVLVKELSSFLGEYEALPEDALISLLQLDPDTTETISASFAKDGSPQMIIAVESATPEDALKCTEKLNYYAQTLKTTADMYSPEQADLLENAWTYTRDNSSFLIISSSLDDLKASLIQSLAAASS